MQTARRPFSVTRRRRSGSPLFAQLLTAAVESAAAEVAIRFNPTGRPGDQQEMTYRELDEASSQLARELIERGIGPGDVVAIGLARSPESVLAVWAIAKAGAAHLPVDPALPGDRIDRIAAGSGAALGLTTSRHRSALGRSLYWMELDDPVQSARIARRPRHPISYADRVRMLDERHPAYIAHTSCPAGDPVAVVVPHSGLAPVVAAATDLYGITSDSRVTHMCSPNTDVSVLELLLTFTTGATLVIVPAGVLGGRDITELLARERVTHMITTPAALEAVDPAGLTELQSVAAIAAEFDPELVRRWAHGRSVLISYGSTETTVLATGDGAVNPGETLTVGTALHGFGAFVLDTRLRPVPPGTAGELYLSGPALAHGYLDRPGLTAQRFVSSPFGADPAGPGARMYRTGALVRRIRTSRGEEIEYLGRADSPVPSPGIEAGEIDSSRHPLPAPPSPLPGGRRPVAPGRPAPVAPASDTPPRAHWAARPGGPGRTVAPVPPPGPPVSRAPSGEPEVRLAALFAEVLGCDHIGADDPFTALGGDHASAVRLVERASSTGIRFTPRDVFEYRTVAGLAEVAVFGKAPGAVPAELPGGGTGPIPPTPILAEYLAGGVHSGFAQTVVLALPEGIDRAGLAATLGAVLSRHEMLRAQLVAEDGRYRLEVPDLGPVAVTARISEVEVPAGARAAELADLTASAMNSTVARLDPLGGRMLAATWLRRPEAADALLLAVHHYVLDGRSWHIVVADLMAAWSQVVRGRRPVLPAVGTSFRRWAHAVSEAAAAAGTELAHWREVLATPDPLLGSRAIDPTTDTRASVRGFTVEIAADIGEVVRTEVPALYRTGSAEPLLAALALAVRNWRSRRGVDCATTRIRVHGDGRAESILPGADLGRTVGSFTTAYPVALDLAALDPRAALAAGPVTAALVRSVKEQLVATGRGIDFGLLRRAPHGTGELDGAVAQIGFGYLDRVFDGPVSGTDGSAWLPTGDLGGFGTEFDRDMPAELVIDTGAAARPDGGITLSFAYAAEIVDEPAVRELADEWLAAVNALARHISDPAAGGLTPSDLPLVRVGQAELDAWRADRPGLADVLPMSPPAEGLYFRSQFTVDGPDDYVMLFAVELGGVIDTERLHIAAQRLLDRHPVLRTAFVPASDGSPVQLVLTDVELPWRVADDVGDYEIPELLENERLIRFPLDTAPLLRITLYRTVSGRTHLVLATHRLLFDNRSFPILVRDLLSAYAARGDLSALRPAPAYRDYLRWLSVRDTATARTRWSEVLRGARPTELAPVLTPPEQPGTGIGEVDLVLGEIEAAAMTAYAAEAGVPTGIVVQALWALVLAGLTGGTDVVFGVAVPGRPLELNGADDTAGLFANTIPARVRFATEWTVRDLLTRIRSEQDALAEHHFLSLADLAPGASGLFDTLLVHEPRPVADEVLRVADGGADGLEVLDLISRTFTHYPVTLLVESGDRLALRLSYRRDLVAEPAARALSGLLHALIGQLLAVPWSPASAPVQDWWQGCGGPGDHGELPADHPRPEVPSGRVGQVSRELAPQMLDSLNDIAARQNTTAFTAVQAALAILLARLSGHRDIVVGAFSTGESAPGLSVLHTTLDPALRFGELIAAARDGGAVTVAGRGAERLGQLIDTVRTAAGRPPFRVLLASGEGPAKLPDTLDLRVNLVDTGIDTRLIFTYARDLFDAPTVGDHADRLLRLLHAVVADPGLVVGDIDLLAPGERDLVLREWNSGGVRVPAVTLVDLIEAQARLRPRAPAVRSGGTTLSFDDLLRRSYRVARALIAAGAGPETLVAVAMPRTEDLPVALLGVLVSGAGYLPLDTTDPRRRLAFVLDDARPVAVLTTAAEHDALPAGDVPVILLEDTARHSGEPVRDDERRARLRPDNLAYVLYTSGSTGLPKGVGAVHRNVVELFANTQLLFEFDDADVWTLLHSCAFDFSVWELWCALASGGSVVVVDRPATRAPELLRELLVREQVTVLNLTPSAFDEFAEADRVAALDGADALALRYVVFGGEALDLRRLRPWYERHGGPGGAEADSPWPVNMYGITETTVHISFLALDEQLVDSPAGVIGRALPGSDIFVLDERLHPAPVGVPGEIYVAGAQLTRGYHARPGSTATRFVADPFGPPGSRMFRSGDIARWAGFGGRANLEYAGRGDTQVKVRGHRIELGEIEAALLRCPGVTRAVALLGAGDRLLGYVVPVAGRAEPADPVRLREQIAEFLPGHMLPDTVVVLDALPFTPNGKLDRSALPDPAGTGEVPYTAPSEPVAKTVAGVFADVLGAEQVGADHDFFALGGNSLTAVRAVARINAALSAEITVRTLFDAPTVGALATRVVPRVPTEVERPVLVRADRPERIPLSPAQHRMWLRNRADPESAADNIVLTIGLTGALDISALRYALSDVLERHEPLRTCYPADPDGRPYQEILPVARAVRGGLESVTTDDVPGRIAEMLTPGFDITDRAPIRGLLLTTDTDEHVLAMVVHNIAADEASSIPLMRDLMIAYRARVGGESPRWSPLSVQYTDYVVWQRALVGTVTDDNSVAAVQSAYWRDRLRGLSGVPELPLDRPRPARPSMRGGSTGFAVPTEVHEALDRLARDRGATLFMVLHAAVGVLLHQLTGADDFAVGTPVARREERVLDDLVGRFADTVTLRTRLESELPFAELLDRTREIDLAAFANADIPFEHVAELVVPERGTAHDALFGVVLSVRDREPAALELPGLVVRAPYRGGLAAKYDLRIDIDPGRDADGAPGELRAALTYPTDLFDETTVRSFGRRLARILTAVAADSRIPVGELDIPDIAGRRREIVPADPVTPTATAGTALAQTLSASVEDEPDGPAVVWGESAVTYRDLDARSSRLARVLIARGFGPGTGVVSALDRGVDAVVAVWAILKAGATLVPADALDIATGADLMVEAGLAVGRAPDDPAVKWLLLDDPVVAGEIAAESPRPVTYADRARPLRGSDLVVLDGTGSLVSYDRMAAAVTRVHSATELNYEARTFRAGRGDSPAGLLEIVAAGAAGAAVVLVQEPGATPAGEWVTHLWSDGASLAMLDPYELEDLFVLVLDEAGPPGAAWAEIGTVLDLPSLLGG